MARGWVQDIKVSCQLRFSPFSRLILVFSSYYDYGVNFVCKDNRVAFLQVLSRTAGYPGQYILHMSGVAI
jgi:hypothetical protein